MGAATATVPPSGPRDACATYIEQTKLLVTLASAFIVAPAVLIPLLSTKDKVAITNNMMTPLLRGEMAFIGSVLFGYLVLATIAGFQHQNVYDVNRPATRVCSIIQIIAYLIGLWYFVHLLVATLGPVVAVPNKPGDALTAEMFRAGDPTTAFQSGSSAPSNVTVLETCRIRKILQEAGSTSALVIGRHDRRPLTLKGRALFGSNTGLAQQRGDVIGAMLKNGSLCPAPPVEEVLVVVGGPRNTDVSNFRTPDPAKRADLLGNDRRVEVYGFRIRPLQQGRSGSK